MECNFGAIVGSPDDAVGEILDLASVVSTTFKASFD